MKVKVKTASEPSQTPHCRRVVNMQLLKSWYNGLVGTPESRIHFQIYDMRILKLEFLCFFPLLSPQAASFFFLALSKWSFSHFKVRKWRLRETWRARQNQKDRSGISRVPFRMRYGGDLAVVVINGQQQLTAAFRIPNIWFAFTGW